MQHILLVEDDASLAQWIIEYLLSHGFLVSHANDGEVAEKLIEEDDPDLVILDVMLPGKSGFDICKQVRHFYTNPILMLTACNEETDEILGLELGATDFVGKPVRPRILLARIKALLRREQKPEIDQQVICLDGLTVDNLQKTVHLADKPIKVTSSEFNLLWLLASNAGEIVTREQLLTALRGIEYDGFDRSIDVAISRLRKKLQDTNPNQQKIKTIRAKGYLLVNKGW